MDLLYISQAACSRVSSASGIMYILIKRERPVDQKYNVLYFLLDDQWFNLTANDMKTTLFNAGMEYHEPKIIHGT